MNDYNSDSLSLSQALELIKDREGKSFSAGKVNLAELERLTGITRAKLRRLKGNGFKEKPHGLKGRKSPSTVLSGFAGVLDNLLRNNVTNSEVCFERIAKLGYKGGMTTVKNYVSAHKDLVPAKRRIVSPQGNRGRRYFTEPGQCFQMDWGFVKVKDYSGDEYQAACFAMICHHCGERYAEFFPNAKQENLFIGMIRAFAYMGVPKFVLTDNMKSVVTRRGSDGRPIWNKDYEVFMKAVGFETRLCKPYHPFTKGKVERLMQFVKGNFLAGMRFANVTELNAKALEWCSKQNGLRRGSSCVVPRIEHDEKCSKALSPLRKTREILLYLCPPRRISFDGFVTYEGRRFGVPYSYSGKTVRVCRNGSLVTVHSEDMARRLAEHDVTWSRKDSFCKGQYDISEQPEEFPTAPVRTVIERLEPERPSDKFARFDFSGEAKDD